MCGIFGYVGQKDALPILVEGLRTLEYRGYDSAGIYLPGQPVVKAVGPIDNLDKKITGDIPGMVGIAHTRWATHGEPTETNAHPHLDMSGEIAVVHNGIIENFRELRAGLIVQGIKLTSDTDTEVLSKLIGVQYKGDLLQAVRSALSLVRGTYGIMVSSSHHPDLLVTARLGSPVVIGLAENGNLISSDSSALLAHTKDVIYLEDGECAVVTKNSYEIMTIAGKKLNKKPEKVEWDVESVKKQGYEHFMLKEIFEAPEVIENTIRGRLVVGRGRAKLGGLESVLGGVD